MFTAICEKVNESDFLVLFYCFEVNKQSAECHVSQVGCRGDKCVRTRDKVNTKNKWNHTLEENHGRWESFLYLGLVSFIHDMFEVFRKKNST